MSQQTPFWLENYKVLFSSVNLVPSYAMTENEKLNALTRLIIIISLFLFFLHWSCWWVVLLVGIGIVIILYYSSLPPVKVTVDHYRYRAPTYMYTPFSPNREGEKEEKKRKGFRIKARGS